MPVPTSTEHVKRPTAREQVYRRLRTWIIEGVLKPGEVLRDQTLAESLGVSRTPVREALRTLEDEGLVETASNRWTRVAPLETEQADKLYGLVQVLEDYALSLAMPQLNSADFEALEDANARLTTAVKEHSPPAALEADNAFHQVWIERSGDVELARVLGEVKAKLRRLELAHFDSTDASASICEHERIITSLRARKRASARQALTGNWVGTTDRFSRRVARRKA